MTPSEHARDPDPPAARQRLRVLYTGRVQGVGFRYTCQRISKHYANMTGAVRNLPDGRVELHAQGAPAEVAAFLDSVRAHFMRGGVGVFGRIDREEVSEQEPIEGESGFRVAR